VIVPNSSAGHGSPRRVFDVPCPCCRGKAKAKGRPREVQRDADSPQDAGDAREHASALGFGGCAFDDAIDEQQDDGAYY
jgi:hypothetical protein